MFTDGGLNYATELIKASNTAALYQLADAELTKAFIK
jgi:hypothetical protein